MYKLFVDKNEDFECEVSVKNASLKGSLARLVVESSDGPNLIFKGTMNNGKCVIPISSPTTGSAAPVTLQGYTQVTIGGTAYWMPYYSSP